MRVLAERRSIGGTCQWCGAPTPRGSPVFRVDDGRRRVWTVKPGPGRAGSWVCQACAGVADRQPPLFPVDA